MASVYRKKTGVYYISVMFQRKRITRSLGTRSYKTARKLISQVEKQILSDMINGNKGSNNTPLSFLQLVDRYLVFPNHDWCDSTRRRYRILLDNYLADGLPANPTTRAMTIRVLNSSADQSILPSIHVVSNPPRVL